LNGAERDTIRELTAQISEWRVSVARVVVPRDEIDQRESRLRDRIAGSETRAMRWAISLGVLNLGGWISLIWVLGTRQ